MIHLYGVVDGLDELPPVRGLDGAPLECRSLEGLELVFSRSSAPPSAEVSREAVLQHAQVVEELAGRSGAILPAQLGHAFRDDDELATAVREQAAQLARRLERVRGCVEFGLRVTVAKAGGAVPEAETGADYLRVRLEQARRLDGLAERLHEPLARLSRATTRQRRPDGFSAAYLVAREDVAQFREAATRLDGTPEATVVCTGPWPPYSFASEARS